MLYEYGQVNEALVDALRFVNETEHKRFLKEWDGQRPPSFTDIGVPQGLVVDARIGDKS